MRTAEIDILRGLGALAVVLIHTASAVVFQLPTHGLGGTLLTAVDQLSRFSVPLFLFLSGLGLARGYGNKPLDLRRYFTRRLSRAFVPYFAWTTIYLVLRGLLNQKWSYFEPATYLGHLIRGTGQYHLYFMVILFQFYLLFPLLKDRNTRLVAVAGNLIGFGTATLFFYTDPTGFLGFFDRRYHIYFLPWLGFFSAGLAAGAQLDAFTAWVQRRWPWLLGLAALMVPLLTVEVLSWLANPHIARGYATTFVRPTAMLYATVAIVGLYGWALKTKTGQLLSQLGRYSMGIYLIHPLVLTGLERLLGAWALAHPVRAFVAYSMLVPALSYAAVAVGRRLPGLARLLGLA